MPHYTVRIMSVGLALGASALGSPATLAAAAAAAAAAAPANETVNLPEYTVQADRYLPPMESWRYARIKGFEIISSLPDSDTRKFVRDFQRLHDAIEVVWPSLQQQLPRDSFLVLCGLGRFWQFVPTSSEGSARTTVSMSNGASAALVVDQGSSIVSLFGEGRRRGADTDYFGLDVAPTVASIGASDLAGASGLGAEHLGSVGGGLSILSSENVGDIAPFVSEKSDPLVAVASEVIVDHRGQQRREYLHFLFTQLERPLPAWLEEGLSRLFMSMEISDRQIHFAGLRGDTPDEVLEIMPETQWLGGMYRVIPGEKEFNTVLAQRAFMPLDEFFAVQSGDIEAANTVTGRWSHQAVAFVHMNLYGWNGKYQERFLRFVDRAMREPVTEALFRECYGMSFAEMAISLRGYIQKPVYKEVKFVAKKGEGLEEPPEVELRNATDAEVGRIKGVVLRLAGHDGRAHNELVAAYVRGERDPALLGELGIQETITGKPERARKFLEAAAKEKVVNPRVYVELAKLRLAEAAAAPKGENGRIGNAQLAAVLQALFTARSQSPPMVEVYEVMAQAWSQAAAKPKPANLDVLNEGILRFPRAVGLIYQAAVLHADNGIPNHAAVLVKMGLKIAPDDSTRGRFEALGRRLAMR